VCGLAGFLQTRELDENAAPTAERMAQAVAHRGPDDCGVWTDATAGIALGHRRLAIIDLSPAGHQPMTSASGRYVIVYNGEIYNFRELRAELDQLGAASWRGSSDTEVLLAAIDQWGIRHALNRVNGMFAFAVWDRAARTLTLARDRMGEKPLFYGSTGGAFLFGSELKALQVHPEFNGRLDLDALTSMLRYDYIPAPRTIWQGISKLEAGHYVEIGDGGRTVGAPTAYWSLRDCAVEGSAHPLPDDPGLVGDLETLLSDAVGRRMIADVPLGAFLSGGIDSSLIVALMQSQSSRPIQTFTIGFEESEFDEAPRARAVAEHIGTDHTELYITPSEAIDVIPRLPAIWDEPFGDSSQIPTYLISALSRQSVTVALSGDGGDELFGGYSRFQTIRRIWDSIGGLPARPRKMLAASLGRASRNALVPGAIGRGARIIGAETLEDLYRWRISRVEQAHALVPGSSSDAESSAFGAAPFIADPAAKMMYADTLTYLPEDILTKVDRASMAVSLEVRAPFLDHRVVEFSWRLPMSQKLNRESSKAILRSLGRRDLPPQVMARGKMGFCVPVSAWLKGRLRGWADDLLSEERLSRQGIVDVSAVRRLWTDFLAGKKRHERIVWNLLMFEAWRDANVSPVNIMECGPRSVSRPAI
jgi:asparagine synthase (glutamine-hydrolysing)